MNRRPLTESETAILGVIQRGYGMQNSATDVEFPSSGDATLFVKDVDGRLVIFANLTNLGGWRTDGTIATDEDLWREWLRVPDA